MRYLTGATGGITPAIAATADIGLMLQPGNGYHSLVESFPHWAADNGCFAQGSAFDVEWSCYRGGVRHCGTCGTCVERRAAFVMATVPDPTEYDS